MMKTVILTVATVGALVGLQMPAYAQQAATPTPTVTVVKPDPSTTQAADKAAANADSAARTADKAAAEANNAAAKADTTKTVVVSQTMPIDPATVPTTVPTTVPQGSYTTAELMKHNVKNNAGDDIASIQSLVMSSSGQVEYVVLGFGGFLGMGEKEVMLPWTDFRIDDQNNMLTANLTKDQIENLPEMSK